MTPPQKKVALVPPEAQADLSSWMLFSLISTSNSKCAFKSTRELCVVTVVAWSCVLFLDEPHYCTVNIFAIRSQNGETEVNFFSCRISGRRTPMYAHARIYNVLLPHRLQRHKLHLIFNQFFQCQQIMSL